MALKTCVLSLLLCATALAAPTGSALVARAGTSCTTTLTPDVFSGEMWIDTITHNGTSAFGPSGYTVYRNVMNYGCKGDGVTDDTNCINTAISTGGRCGSGCGESTTTPAVVYFPAGKYLISSPIVLYYYTQMIGNALNPPTLIMAPSFTGIGLIDSDPYGSGGANWYGDTNNFYRQVRNFIIDLTKTSATSASTGIHWQVAQATSLTNIVFQMSTASNTAHQGIWMENGSGGFISDLVFNGGKYGIWVGNQQFTSRNLTMNNCQTAIYMNWNWAWTFKTLNINNCALGLDMTAGGTSAQAVGSITLLDVSITNTPVGVLTGTSSTSQTKTSGSLILDNIQTQNVPVIVKGSSGNTILAGSTGSTNIASWGQGSLYTSTSGTGTFNQNTLTAPTKGSNLLASNGKFFERMRPQYENYAVSDFVSVKGEYIRKRSKI
jgi:glucan 1,3-beta-glucosidase